MTSDRRLSKRAATAVRKAQSAGDFWVSIFSIWELARKIEKGQLALDRPLDAWLDAALAVEGVQLAEVTRPILVDRCRLPQAVHGDPADQMLVATSRAWRRAGHARRQAARLSARANRLVAARRAGAIAAPGVTGACRRLARQTHSCDPLALSSQHGSATSLSPALSPAPAAAIRRPSLATDARPSRSRRSWAGRPRCPRSTARPRAAGRQVRRAGAVHAGLRRAAGARRGAWCASTTVVHGAAVPDGVSRRSLGDHGWPTGWGPREAQTHLTSEPSGGTLLTEAAVPGPPVAASARRADPTAGRRR